MNAVFSLTMPRPSPTRALWGYAVYCCGVRCRCGAFLCHARDGPVSDSVPDVQLKRVFKVFPKIFSSFHCFQAVIWTFFNCLREIKEPRQKRHKEDSLCVRSCRGSCLSYEDFSSLTRLRGSREAPVSPAKTSALFRVPENRWYLFCGRLLCPPVDPLQRGARFSEVQPEIVLAGRAFGCARGSGFIEPDDCSAAHATDYFFLIRSVRIVLFLLHTLLSSWFVKSMYAPGSSLYES